MLMLQLSTSLPKEITEKIIFTSHFKPIDLPHFFNFATQLHLKVMALVTDIIKILRNVYIPLIVVKSAYCIHMCEEL